MADAPKQNPHAERIASLAAQHAQEVVDALVDVMRNPKSRQRVNAAMHLAELMLAAAPPNERALKLVESREPPMSRDEAVRWFRDQQAKRAQGGDEG